MAWVIFFSLLERWVPGVSGGPRDQQTSRTVHTIEIPFWERRFSYGGHRFEPHEIKRDFLLYSAHKALADVFPVVGISGCSAEFRAEVEALEPGVHQFFPISIRRPPRSKKPILRLDGREARDGDFFLFNCLQLIDAVIPERCSGPSLVRKAGSDRFGFNPREDDLCVSREMVSGRHLWLGDKQGVGGYFFVSDALMERFRAAGLKGFDAKRVREA